MVRREKRAAVLIGLSVMLGAGPAFAQDNLDRGKTLQQVYATDCGICHSDARKVAASMQQRRLAGNPAADADGVAGALERVEEGGALRVELAAAAGCRLVMLCSGAAKPADVVRMAQHAGDMPHAVVAIPRGAVDDRRAGSRPAARRAPPTPPGLPRARPRTRRRGQEYGPAPSAHAARQRRQAFGRPSGRGCRRGAPPHRPGTPRRAPGRAAAASRAWPVDGRRGGPAGGGRRGRTGGAPTSGGSWPSTTGHADRGAPTPGPPAGPETPRGRGRAPARWCRANARACRSGQGSRSSPCRRSSRFLEVPRARRRARSLQHAHRQSGSFDRAGFALRSS